MNLCDLIFVVKWKLHSVKKVMHEYGRIHSSEEHGTCYFNKPCGTFLKKTKQIKLYWVVGKRVWYSDWEKII